MSLSLALNNALSGLNVNRQSLAVLSQNIANANNPNYTRKTIDQSAVSIDGNGAGVSIEAVSRKVDTYLQQAIQQQQGVVGRTDALETYAARIQTLLGKPGSGGSLDAYVSSYFTSVQSLAETPESSALRLNAVNSGVQLASNISDLADQLQALRFDADQEISKSVSTVNVALKNLYDTNAALASTNSLGQSQGDLLDKRDQLVKTISQNMDVNLYFVGDGSVHLYTAGGQTLLDNNLYSLNYQTASSAASFSGDQSLFPIAITRVDARTGAPLNEPSVLVEGAASSQIAPVLTTGRMRGLMDVRDSKIPSLIQQLDNMAANLRDAVNAVHNEGTGFPGANGLNGTRAVAPADASLWEGGVRIAVLGEDGKPVGSPYGNEPNGLLPLNIDLSKLNSGLGDGPGRPNVQTVIDEINRYYGVPSTKVSVGDLNNIQLASQSLKLPGSPPQFSFDLDLANISGNAASITVPSIQVLDDTSTDITSFTTPVSSFDLDGASGFTTTNGLKTVTITTASAHNFVDGQRVYISATGAVNGIPQSDFNAFFTVANVNGNSFDIVVENAATSSGAVSGTGIKAYEEYTRVESGTQSRTTANGAFTANLSGNPNSAYFTVRASVVVTKADGTVARSVIDYKIINNQTNLYNARSSAIAANGAGVLTAPVQKAPLVKAMLVDEKGMELSKQSNGQYYPDAQGYVKITARDGAYLAIDSQDSKQVGRLSNGVLNTGTGRGFSHYFELNNFFASNIPSALGDTVKGSAQALEVEERLTKNPGLVSTGKLALTRKADGFPSYTYERNVGDNSIVQKLGAVASQQISFAAAGGLAPSAQSITSYTGEILSYAAFDASAASANKSSAETLLSGFTDRATSISGVNLDEELANTVIYQNAYSASARVITVADELFRTLLDAF